MISRIIDKITEWTGKPSTSVLTIVLIAVDLVWGWHGGWTTVWINGNGAATGFLAIILLFLLQHSTNRGNRALHAKLDAQVAENDALDNRLIGSEALPESEIMALQEQSTAQKAPK